MNYEFSPIEKKIEGLFTDNPNDPVDVELFKWFMFSSTGKGSLFINLGPLEFEDFKHRLSVMIDSVYTWHNEMQTDRIDHIIKTLQQPSDHDKGA